MFLYLSRYLAVYKVQLRLVLCIQTDRFPTHCLWLRPWTRRLYKVLSSNLSCHPLIPTLEVNKLRLNYCKQSILSKIHHSHIYFCYIYYQFCYVYLCMNKNIYNLTIFLGIIKLFSQKERLDTMTYRTLLIVYH